MRKSRYQGKSHNLNARPDSNHKRFFKRSRVLTPIPNQFVDGPNYPLLETIPFTVRKRPVIIDVERIPLPDRIQDVFNMLPTLNLGRMAALERMRMNKIMTFKEEILLKDAAEEFDNEVSQSIEENLGRDRRMPPFSSHPDPGFMPMGTPDDENDNFVNMHPRKRRNLGYDDMDESMI